MIEVLKQALEHGSFPQGSGIIHDLKKAIAELESQEPVAWKVTPRYEDSDGYFDFTDSNETAKELERRGWSITSLYTHPPQRTWVELNDDELLHIGVATGLERAAVEMISNKLKEKNSV